MCFNSYFSVCHGFRHPLHCPKGNRFPRYNTKCSGENEILRGIFREVSISPLYFVYLGGAVSAAPGNLCRWIGVHEACQVHRVPPLHVRLVARAHQAHIRGN